MPSLGSLLLLALLDLGLLIFIGCTFGGWALVGCLFVPALLGGLILIQQGRSHALAIRNEIQAGRLPSEKMVEGGVMIFAGVMLVVPGPLSTLIGITLLLPFVRHIVVRRFLSRKAQDPSASQAVTGVSMHGAYVHVVSYRGPGGPPGYTHNPGGIKNVEAQDPEQAKAPEIEPPKESNEH